MNNREQEDELSRMRMRRAQRKTANGRSGSRAVQSVSRHYQEDLDREYSFQEGYGERPGSPESDRFRDSQNGYSRDNRRRAGYDRNPGSGRGSGGSTAGNSKRKRAVNRRRKRRLKQCFFLILICLIGWNLWGFLHRPTGYWNVAVFGVDSRDGDTKKALADVQMICSLNRRTGEVRLVSVYRDTYLKIDSEGNYHKINEAYFKGGQKQALAALEENLDLKIDDYAAFNWKAVAEAINVLGGIDLEITEPEFKYINGFITETVESTGIGSVHLSSPGMNHLDGVQAVAYSRLRLMDTDFQRTERQRKVVNLALEKAKSAGAGTLTKLVKAILPQISTSIGINDLLPMAKNAKTYYIGETGGFPFSRKTQKVGKMDCVIPTTLESNVVLLHQFLYGEDVSYSPSAAVKKISSHISEKTGLYEEGTPAPSSGSSKSSGKSSEKPTDPVKQAPEATAPAETTPEETTAPESSPEETLTEEMEETSGFLPEEDEKEPLIRPLETETERESEQEIGPGMTKPQHETDAPPAAPTQEETEGGPGVAN